MGSRAVYPLLGPPCLLHEVVREFGLCGMGPMSCGCWQKQHAEGRAPAGRLGIAGELTEVEGQQLYN